MTEHAAPLLVATGVLVATGLSLVFSQLPPGADPEDAILGAILAVVGASSFGIILGCEYVLAQRRKEDDDP